MVAQRVRIPCPNCSRVLRIRVAALGRRGQCKYCGHCFEAQSQHSTIHAGRATETRQAHEKPGSGQRVPLPETPFEKNWAALTDRQARMVEQLMAALGRRIPEGPGARAWAPVDVSRRLARPGDHPAVSVSTSSASANANVSAPGHHLEPPDQNLADDEPIVLDDDQIVVQFDDPLCPPAAEAPMPPASSEVNAGTGNGVGIGTGTPASSLLVLPQGGLVPWLDRLVRERDEARARCDRLRRERRDLREELAGRRVEEVRYRVLSQQLEALRREYDQVESERASLVKDAVQLQTRLVQTQVALVEVEKALKECRERARMKREQWHRERAELMAEIDRLVASSASTLETEEYDEPAQVAAK